MGRICQVGNYENQLKEYRSKKFKKLYKNLLTKAGKLYII